MGSLRAKVPFSLASNSNFDTFRFQLFGSQFFASMMGFFPGTDFQIPPMEEVSDEMSPQGVENVCLDDCAPNGTWGLNRATQWPCLSVW